jgi:hypothetical protein
MLAEPATNHRAVSDENAPRPSRVMIVDDSAVAHGLISRWVEADVGLKGVRP